MAEIRPSICRLCTAFCPLLVEVENERAVKVMGDPSNTLYKGYTCPKGRALAEQHSAPTRLLHSLKRGADGVHRQISSEHAMDEIAAKLTEIITLHGPRSVALYMGTGSLPYPVTMPAARSWLRGIGSNMFFTPGAIDQPGKSIASALHGGWQAGEQSFDDADTYMLIGMNPVISKCHGILGQNPGRKLKDAVARGLKMIVIDPRRTETVRRAALHLAPRPGEDPTLLAGIVNIIIQEKLYDADFVAEYAEGFEALAAAVRDFTPDYVSERAGVPAEDIIKAARMFGEAKRGCVIAGTGPSFATRGTITEYLCLSLNTICGRWTRAGEKSPRPNVMLPAFTARAQPSAPFQAWGYGEKLRVRGLGASACGMPTAGLADEMLLEGEGQVKALICVAGNPMMSWPDQPRVRAALDKLDLLVSIDCEMRETAQLSHYVIAPQLSFEAPGMSQSVEGLKHYGFGLGFPKPWAQYAPRITKPPEGSDVIEDWLFFVGLSKRMGIKLKLQQSFRAGQYIESPPVSFAVDPDNPITTEEAIEHLTKTSRVPLDVVKSHPNGRIYEEVEDIVLPREDGHTARLQLGDPYIMGELAQVRGEDYMAKRRDEEFPFLLCSRRENNFLNSIGRSSAMLTAGKTYNPLSMHPDDMAAQGLVDGQSVAIRSMHETIWGVVEADNTLRRGMVTMSQNFGGQPDENERYIELGSNTGKLLSAEDDFDPITGIPRMGALHVMVTPLEGKPIMPRKKMAAAD
jgi:anaerobic selenocysteine-containing dehydrogenase